MTYLARIFFILILVYIGLINLNGQGYQCDWNSNLDKGFAYGQGTMRKQYKIDYIDTYFKMKKSAPKGKGTFHHQYAMNLSKWDAKYKRISYQFNNKIIVQNANDKYGVTDCDLNLLLEPKYDEIFRFLDLKGWLLKKDEAWTLVDSTFQSITPEKFDHVKILTDEYFIAKMNNDFFLCHSSDGVIKNFGEACFQTILFDFYKKSFYLVIKKGNTRHLYNKEGNNIFECKSGDQLRRARSISDHLDAVTIKRGDKMGLVSGDGSYTIPIKYKSIVGLSGYLKEGEQYFNGRLGSQYVLLNGADSILVSDERLVSSRKFKNSLRASKYTYIFYMLNGKKGYYNMNSGYVSETKYDKLFPWSTDKMIVGNNDLYGMIDSLGNEFIPMEYTDFDQNANSIIAIRDSIYSLIDLDGNVRMPLIYSKINSFRFDRSGNLDRATFTRDGKVGYYDSNFNEVIPPIFKIAREFQHNLACVEINGNWGFIDEFGEVVIPAIYDRASYFHNEEAKVKLHGKEFWINKQGECIKSCDE